MILSEVSLIAPLTTSILHSERHILLTMVLSLYLVIVANNFTHDDSLISDFASYLFSSKDRENIDVKVIS